MKVCWTLWCLLTIIAWIFTFSFIYFMQNLWGNAMTKDGKHKQVAKSQIQTKRLFAILMTTTNIAISLHVTFALPACLFWIHLYRGNYIAPDIDYQTDLNECNYGVHNFNSTLSLVFGPPNAIFYDLSCIMILITYFYRLHKLFVGTQYALSKLKCIIFIILILLFVAVSVSRQYYTIKGNIHVFLTLWNTFLVIYLIISIYLVWNLQRQATKLKQETIRVALRSIKVTISHHPYQIGTDQKRFNENLSEAKIDKNMNENRPRDQTSQQQTPHAMKMAHARVNNLIKVFGRLLVLAYVCVVSSLLVVVLSFLVHAVFIHYISTKYSYIWDLIYWTLIFSDNVINIACISLQFDNFGYFDWIYLHCCKHCQKHLKLMNNKIDDYNLNGKNKKVGNINASNQNSNGKQRLEMVLSASD